MSLEHICFTVGIFAFVLIALQVAHGIWADNRRWRREAQEASDAPYAAFYAAKVRERA